MSGVRKCVDEQQSWPPSQLNPQWKFGMCRYCRFGKQAKSLLVPVAGPARFVHCHAATMVVCSYISYLHVPVDNDSPDAVMGGQVLASDISPGSPWVQFNNLAMCPAVVWVWWGRTD